jgi:hypothetical protein
VRIPELSEVAASSIQEVLEAALPQCGPDMPEGTASATWQIQVNESLPSERNPREICDDR